MSGFLDSLLRALAPIDDIKEEHFKVGDGMAVQSNPYHIFQMALVIKGNDAYEVRFYDSFGVMRSSVPMLLDKSRLPKSQTELPKKKRAIDLS